MKYSVGQDIILDNRPKVIISTDTKVKTNAELDEKYLLVRYRQKGDSIEFFTKSSNRQKAHLSACMPANVIALINASKKILALFNAVNIELTDKIKPNELLRKLYEIKDGVLRNEIVLLQRQNYEIRKLLENTKQTLLELSTFANSTGLPLSKKEFEFPIERKAGSLSLKKGKAYRQNIPISSEYLSGIRLFFKFDTRSHLLYAMTDTLCIKLITKESQSVIGAWEIPFGKIENSIVLELVAPYIQSKESIYLYVRHNAQIDLKIRLSKQVLNKRFQFISDDPKKSISKSPIALEVYKNYHTFSLLSSPFIKKHDRLFGEFERAYISRRLIENSVMIVGSELSKENGEIEFSEDRFSVTIRRRVQIQIGNAVSPGVKLLSARVRVMQGFGELGIALVSDTQKDIYLDDVMLKLYEKEGYFSGWVDSKADTMVLSIPLVNVIDEPMHLVLLMKNHLNKVEYRVEWNSFELYFDEAF